MDLRIVRSGSIPLRREERHSVRKREVGWVKSVKAEWNPDKVIHYSPSPSSHVGVSFSPSLVESPTTSRIPVSPLLFSDVLTQSQE